MAEWRSVLEKRVQPIVLDACTFRRQHRRPERRLGDELQEITAVAFDDVAPDAVSPAHERAPLDDEVTARALYGHGLRRLNLALEAHDRREQAVDLFVGEFEVRHPQLVERIEHAAFVEHPRVVELGPEPRDLRGVRKVFDEGEVETRDELGALFGQLGPDRLRRLEALDLVATEAAVAVDDPLSELQLLGLRIELGERPLARPRTA